MKQTFTMIALCLVLSGANADTVGIKEVQMTIEQKQKISEAIRVLIDFKVLQNTEEGSLQIEPNIFDKLNKEGLLKSDSSRNQFICFEPPK